MVPEETKRSVKAHRNIKAVSAMLSSSQVKEEKNWLNSLVCKDGRIIQIMNEITVPIYLITGFLEAEKPLS